MNSEDMLKAANIMNDAAALMGSTMAHLTMNLGQHLVELNQIMCERARLMAFDFRINAMTSANQYWVNINTSPIYNEQDFEQVLTKLKEGAWPDD